MSSSNKYYKDYRRAEREMKNGERNDMIDDRVEIRFKSKKITLKHFKDLYKEKLKTKEQEYLFNNCLDLITLIDNNKKVLESEGTYIKNASGVLKVNPAKKELREDLKAFSSMITLLNQTLVGEEDEDLEGWLNE